MRKAFALTLACLFAASALAEDGERTFSGPARYCGYAFAIDLEPDEHVEVQNGPDFMLEGFVSPRGGFGLYEGFAPQDGTGDKKIEAGLPKPTYRLKKRDDAFGYVIWTGDKSHPFYLHVWGAAFKGNDQDFPLLRRLQLGDAGKRDCPQPTFQ